MSKNCSPEVSPASTVTPWPIHGGCCKEAKNATLAEIQGKLAGLDRGKSSVGQVIDALQTIKPSTSAIAAFLLSMVSVFGSVASAAVTPLYVSHNDVAGDVQIMTNLEDWVEAGGGGSSDHISKNGSTIYGDFEALIPVVTTNIAYGYWTLNSYLAGGGFYFVGLQYDSNGYFLQYMPIECQISTAKGDFYSTNLTWNAEEGEIISTVKAERSEGGIITDWTLTEGNGTIAYDGSGWCVNEGSWDTEASHKGNASSTRIEWTDDDFSEESPFFGWGGYVASRTATTNIVTTYIRTKVVTQRDISANDATFTNAVLQTFVGGVDTNSIAILKSISGLPEGTLGTTGGTLAALIAALIGSIVWLKNNKVNNPEYTSGSGDKFLKRNGDTLSWADAGSSGPKIHKFIDSGSSITSPDDLADGDLIVNASCDSTSMDPLIVGTVTYFPYGGESISANLLVVTSYTAGSDLQVRKGDGNLVILLPSAS